MKTTEHGIEDSKDIENMHHMRLMTLLQELVRDKGFKGAARVLEVDQRTVSECAKTGQLSRRVRQALERALQEGVGSAAERQQERNEELEGRVEGLAGEVKGVAGEIEALGKELRRRMAAVEGEIGALKRSDAQGTGPVMPAPVPPGRRPVRRTLEADPRRGPGCGGSTPTS